MYDMNRSNDPLQPAHAAAERDEYPPGLEITLNSETLRNLALDVGDFQIGQVLDITGQAIVTSINASPKQIQGAEQSVALQICALALGDEEDDEQDDMFDEAPLSLAEKLYGS